MEERCGNSERDVPVLKQRVDGMQDILIEIREEQRWQRRALQGLLLTVISSVLVAALLTFVGAGP